MFKMRCEHTMEVTAAHNISQSWLNIQKPAFAKHLYKHIYVYMLYVFIYFISFLKIFKYFFKKTTKKKGYMVHDVKRHLTRLALAGVQLQRNSKRQLHCADSRSSLESVASHEKHHEVFGAVSTFKTLHWQQAHFQAHPTVLFQYIEWY